MPGFLAERRNIVLEEFKKFAFKGNVIDMAVGVIIGGAFGTIVNSLVNDIIMPIFGFLTAGMDFKSLKIVLSEAVTEGSKVIKPEAAIYYGNFIQNFVNFLIIAGSMFIAINTVNKAILKHKEPKIEEEAPKAPTQEELLEEIRDILKESQKLPMLESGKIENKQEVH